MELPRTLMPVFWSAVALLGLSAVVFVGCLNSLVGAHRRALLRVVWIAGALMVSAAVVVLLLLVHF
jgi:hypothetical protein